MNNLRRALFALAGSSLIVAAFGTAPAAIAASAPGYTIANVGPYGGEPSLVSDHNGQLYDTTPQGGTLTYTSTNKGQSWRHVTTADPNTRDDCLATAQANSVYLCNLAGSES